MNKIILIDFQKNDFSNNWKIVNDFVMGGLSTSQFEIDSNNNGRFMGTISLKNNGGFCSVQNYMEKRSLFDKKFFRLYLKGDGRKYQFRVKSNRTDSHSYIYIFETSNQWEEIVVPMKDMYASFRGKKLNLPHFNSSNIEQMAFLIANSIEENFELIIHKIELE